MTIAPSSEPRNSRPNQKIRIILEAAPGIRKSFRKLNFCLLGRTENRWAYSGSLERRTAELGLVDDVIFTGERRDIAACMPRNDCLMRAIRIGILRNVCS